MNQMQKAALAALVAASAFATPGHAQMFQGGWYADIGAGRGRAKDYVTTSDRETTWAARVGARLTPNFGVDVGYYDLGKFDLSDANGGASGSTVKATSWGVSLLAIAPIDAFDVYGRVGYARTETKVDILLQNTGRVLSGSTKDNEAFYGLGARYNFDRMNFGNWNVFAEWNRWDKSKWDSYMLGVGLRF